MDVPAAPTRQVIICLLSYTHSIYVSPCLSFLAFHEVRLERLAGEDVLQHLLIIFHIPELILVQVDPDLSEASQFEASVASERSHRVLEL